MDPDVDLYACGNALADDDGEWAGGWVGRHKTQTYLKLISVTFISCVAVSGMACIVSCTSPKGSLQVATSTTDPQPMGKVGQVCHSKQDRIVSVRECATLSYVLASTSACICSTCTRLGACHESVTLQGGPPGPSNMTVHLLSLSAGTVYSLISCFEVTVAWQMISAAKDNDACSLSWRPSLLIANPACQCRVLLMISSLQAMCTTKVASLAIPHWQFV